MSKYTEERTGFVPAAEKLRGHFLVRWSDGTFQRLRWPVAGYIVVESRENGAATGVYAEPAYLDPIEGGVETWGDMMGSYGRGDRITHVATMPADEEPTVDAWGAAEDSLRRQAGGPA